MPDATKVVVIIPTYNERQNLQRLLPVLLDDIFPFLEKKYKPIVLIVDDSSPDGTIEEVKQQQKKYPDLELLINKEKGGLGKAYISGMEHALKALKAEIVFEFDADLSHDPKKIGKMLATLEEGYDIVLGSRYIKGGSIPQDWGWHRKFLSIVGNKVIQIIMTNFSIHDWTGGYRAIRRKVVETVLPEMNEAKFTGYTFQIGFLHKSVRKGFRVAEVPFHFVDRTHGESKLGPEYIANNLKYILKVRFQEIVQSRLFRFVVVGLFGAVVQLTTLQLFRNWFSFQIAYFLSVEMAVISNFIWSNVWTFADRQLSLVEIPLKFIQFNLASLGSVVIQLIVAFFGEKLIGLFELFKIPKLNYSIDTGMMFAVIGIFLGTAWNYFAYSRIIWKNKQEIAVSNESQLRQVSVKKEQ